MTCMLDLKDAIIILIKGLDLVLNNSSPAETDRRARTRTHVCSCRCRYLHVQWGELRDHKCTLPCVKTPDEMR